MDTVTYPRKNICDFFSDNFVCLKITNSEAGHDEKRFMLDHRLLWSPGYVYLDYRGNEVRKVVGYMAEPLMLANGSIALGLIDMLHGRNEDALKRFRDASDMDTESDAAPEALYWAGVANFRCEGGDKDALWSVWAEIGQKYAKSRWWASADCKEYDPGSKTKSG